LARSSDRTIRPCRIGPPSADQVVLIDLGNLSSGMTTKWITTLENSIKLRGDLDQVAIRS
jgi:hypothetical protein